VKKILDWYDKLEKNVLIGSLLASTLILFLQVVMRKVFNNSLSWSEELTRYIFMWQIWCGISIAQRQGRHIQVDLIFMLVKGQGQKAVRILATILNIGFCCFMVYVGCLVVQSHLSMHTLSPAMRLPLWIVYLSLPFSFLVTMIRYIQALIKEIANTNQPRLALEGE